MPSQIALFLDVSALIAHCAFALVTIWRSQQAQPPQPGQIMDGIARGIMVGIFLIKAAHGIALAI